MIALVSVTPDASTARLADIEAAIRRPLTRRWGTKAVLATDSAEGVSDGRRIELTGYGARLSRCASGGRPVFWASLQGRGYAAATQLRPLAAAIGPAGPDGEALASTLIGRFDDSTHTCLRGIHRLRPGETVELRPSNAETFRAPTAPIAERHEDAEELAAALLVSMREAVARAVRGHRKIAVATGGGLDSSALLALALDVARSAGGPDVEVIALDVGGEGDDRPHLRSLERALGVVPRRVHPSEFAGNVRRALVLDAAPVTHPTAAWDLGMLELAGQGGATALLTGAGGDGLFDGDPECLGYAVLGGDLRAIGEAASLRVPWRSSRRARLREFVARPIARSLAPRAARRALRRWRDRDNAQSWLGPVARERLAAEPHDSERPATSPAERFSRFVNSPGLLFMCDGLAQFEADVGVELASPFLDETLVRFVASIPPRRLLHGGRLRGLFREAIRGLVPESLRLRDDKASFDTALVELLVASGGLRALEDLADMRALDALGLVDAKPFAMAFHRAADNRVEDWGTLWAPLAMEAFAREYVRH